MLVTSMENGLFFLHCAVNIGSASQSNRAVAIAVPIVVILIVAAIAVVVIISAYLVLKSRKNKKGRHFKVLVVSILPGQANKTRFEVIYNKLRINIYQREPILAAAACNVVNQSSFQKC